MLYNMDLSTQKENKAKRTNEVEICGFRGIIV